MERKEYEEGLKKRQEEHNRHLDEHLTRATPWRPCMHDECSECVGTGRKRDGTVCVHMISCPCPKCSPMCAV